MEKSLFHVKPTLSALSAEQVVKIHESVLTILEKTGIKVMDEKAGRVFSDAGCIRMASDRYAISKELVEWAIKAAPDRIQLFRRTGEPAFELESNAVGRSIYGVGVTNLYYQEPLDDRVVPFGRTHMARSALLGESLNEFDVISTPGVIQEEGVPQVEVTGSLEILANTQKPIVLLVSDTDAYRASLEMFDRLVGLDPEKPFVVPYVNPITPMILNAETSYKMDLAIERGLPLVFSNYGMSGATCPITPAGTLTLLTAELLAGLVYCQLKKEGTPVILGSLPAVFNMRTMESYYNPKAMLVNVCCAEMMAHYGIPHCGSSGGWMGWGPDLMASSMIWLNHLTGQLARNGLVPFVGSNFDSLVFSPGMVVYAAEVIRMAREFQTGFSLDDQEVGLDEILRLGPGGNYLTAGLTMKHFRNQSPLSRVWPVLGLEKWEHQGRPQAGSVLREYTKRLLDEAKPPEDHDHILAAGEEIIAGLM